MKRHRPNKRSARPIVHPCRHPRRGSWLVQVVVTMTVMSVLMTIASTSLFQMFRQESRMVERTFRTSTWLRMSQDFRRDVHAALMIRQSENGNRLELVTTDGPVTWLADGEKIRRTTQSQELADETDTSAIASLPGEQFVFVDSVAQLSLTVGTSGTASVASVEVAPLPTPNGGIVPPNVVLATAGLDHRFLASVATAKEQP
jgi:type II secretory pathway pseudopilin PulG